MTWKATVGHSSTETVTLRTRDEPYTAAVPWEDVQTNAAPAPNLNPFPCICVCWVLPAQNSQKDGKCGEAIRKADAARFSGTFYASDVGTSDDLSLHVCAPYGNYYLELQILDDVKPVSGEIGWEIYQGRCKVRAVGTHYTMY